MQMIKSEEDIDDGSDEEEDVDVGTIGREINNQDMDETDDSLARATGTDKSTRSLASLADRNITKVSSTRKLND